MGKPETLSDRIRRLRQAKGLSQLELAQACKVTKAAVSAWETGTSMNIRLLNLLYLKQTLGTTIEYLIEGPEPATHPVPEAVARRPGRRRKPPKKPS